jgi:signal peptidase II
MSSEEPRDPGRADLWALGVTAAVVVAADQLTKSLVAAALGVGERVNVLGDLLILWHTQNTGASFSLFKFDGSQVLFFFVTLLALALIGSFHRSFRGQGVWLHVLLGFVLGGTLGNFVDRLRFGYVTDFISMGFGDTRFPTYNIADASLTLGIIALVALILFRDPSRSRSAES